MGSSWSSAETNETGMANQSSSSGLSNQRLRNPNVTILKEILKTIRLDENLERQNNAILQEFLDTFIAAMKREDELFKMLYRNPFYTGSYYSDLRISMPDEFDINLVLCFPFKPHEFEIIYHPQVPSYAMYHLKDEASTSAKYPQLVKQLFCKGYMMHEKVRCWIQRVVDKARQNYQQLPRNVIKIINSSSGPARTLKLIKRQGLIDIDLVPAVSCTMQTKQPGIDSRVKTKFEETLQGFLVPKPYTKNGQAPVNAEQITRLWRTHFPTPEKDLIHNFGCAKPIIKLLKLLRDKENWKILASYYLKTVVMWMIIENPSPNYWKEDKMGDRFIEALECLSKYISERKIPYFFSKKWNLIDKMNEYQAINIHKRLQSMIGKIKSDPNFLFTIFDVRPTI